MRFRQHKFSSMSNKYEILASNIEQFKRVEDAINALPDATRKDVVKAREGFYNVYHIELKPSYSEQPIYVVPMGKLRTMEVGEKSIAVHTGNYSITIPHGKCKIDFI